MSVEVAQPRVLMLSTRHVNQLLYRHNGYEFEDVICAVDDVHMLAPTTRPRGTPLQGRLLDRLGRLTGLHIELRPSLPPPSIEGEYDVFFVAGTDPGELRRLDLLPWVRQARTRCRIAVCYFEEMWANWLEHDNLVTALQEFDHIMLGCRATCEAAQRATGRPVTYLSPGIDMDRFSPVPNPPRRTYDVRAMGRRSPITHRAFLEWSERAGSTYLYDTTVKCPEGDRETHRVLYAATIKRCRYFLVNPAKVNAGNQTRGQEELGLRFSEGAGGGAVLLGQSPRCSAFEENFDWPDAVIEMPFGSASGPAIIDELDRQPERLAKIRRDNVYHHLRRHDWARRWLLTLQQVGLSARPALLQRLQRHDQLAASLPEDGLVEGAAALEAAYAAAVPSVSRVLAG